ncbi:MAG TPA: cytochrome c peroxidase [Rhodothermales bacterium]
MNRTRLIILPALLVVVTGFVVATKAVWGPKARWSPDELELLKSLSIESLGPVPEDPSNRVAGDPAAARLGHRLFFDARMSRTCTISCASCHVPSHGFQDGLPVGQGVGAGNRRTMPVAGTAYSPWMFWDGRADSPWRQALGPLENPVEHGTDRTQIALLIAQAYRSDYEDVFGSLPDLSALPAHAGPVADSAAAAAWTRLSSDRREAITRVFVNAGKAIAAYERTIGFEPSRFDRYVAALAKGEAPTGDAAFTPDEEAGLRLFIGKASCINCHNGPLFTDNHFHNTGVPLPAGSTVADSGRASAAREAVEGEFSCLGPYSDAGPDDCQELRFAVVEGHELLRAYKTPSLRGVADRAPYMHAGQIASLEEVVSHYNSAPDAPAGHSELRRLRLSKRERNQLVAFLKTLSGPLEAPEGFLEPPAR